MSLNQDENDTVYGCLTALIYKVVIFWMCHYKIKYQ